MSNFEIGVKRTFALPDFYSLLPPGTRMLVMEAAPDTRYWRRRGEHQRRRSNGQSR